MLRKTQIPRIVMMQPWLSYEPQSKWCVRVLFN